MKSIIEKFVYSETDQLGSRSRFPQCNVKGFVYVKTFMKMAPGMHKNMRQALYYLSRCILTSALSAAVVVFQCSPAWNTKYNVVRRKQRGTQFLAQNWITYDRFLSLCIISFSFFNLNVLNFRNRKKKKFCKGIFGYSLAWAGDLQEKLLLTFSFIFRPCSCFVLDVHIIVVV